MLKDWSKSSKVSCLVITYAALPHNDDEWFEEDQVSGWSSRMILKYAKALDIDLNYLVAYAPLLRSSYNLPSETMDMIAPFLHDLRVSGYALQYLMELYIFLVTSGFYDARGRVMIRNCVEILCLSREEYFALEVALAESLHDCEEKLARAAAEKASGASGTKLKRYLKIGAVGLGAGAVIAFTGGIAAPAVAAALLVIGGSTAVAAAGFATFTVLASVFGTAGAGLAGYKMARRTKGIEEFEFEQFGEKGHLAVTIMVSGWMNEAEDYKRTFGILPSAMTLEEAITRFYMTHDKGRAANAKSEAKVYESNPSALVDQITATYGMCPLTPMNLSTPYQPLRLSERDQTLLDKLIQEYVMANGKGGNSKEATDVQLLTEKDDREDAKLLPSSKSSISKSAGRFFKFTSSLMPSKLSAAADGEAAPLSEKSVKDAGAADHIADDVHDEDEEGLELPIPAISQGASIPSSNPTVDVHIIASTAQDVVSWDHRRSEDATLPSGSDAETECIKKLQPSVASRTSQPALKLKADVSAPGSGTEERISETKNELDILPPYWNWTELDVAPLYELYLLKWETEIQLELGSSLAQLMKSLQNAVAEKIISFTVLGLVLSAVALPYTLLKLTDLIDSTWTIALERADAAGKELAEALLSRPQGSRPVTLVGHSIGARLIFSCLVELAKRREEESKTRARCGGAKEENSEQEDESDDIWAITSIGLPSAKDSEKTTSTASRTPMVATDERKSSADAAGDTRLKAVDEPKKRNTNSYGLIQDVVLLGIPVNTSKKAFRRARSVVSGRLVNGYSPKDLCLAFLYRWGAKEAIKVSGLQAVEVDGVENMDLSFMIEKVLTIIDLGRSSSVVDV